MDSILGALWFFLPATVANAVPVLSNKIPVVKDWDTPMDFGKTYRGRRIFGTNKRWRGLLTGTFAAGLTGMLQVWLYQESAFVQEIAFFDYAGTVNAVWLAMLLGLGALLGDAIESFFKRQVGVKSGEPWLPYDQIDWIFGGLLLSLLLVQLTAWQYLLVFLVAFLLHPLGTLVGYILRLKDKPF